MTKEQQIYFDTHFISNLVHLWANSPDPLTDIAVLVRVVLNMGIRPHKDGTYFQALRFAERAEYPKIRINESLFRLTKYEIIIEKDGLYKYGV